jgi:hypothetical protein
MDVVALQPDKGCVNASYALKPLPVIVTGLEPIAVNDVQDAVPEQETEVVAMPSCVELPQYVR